MCVQTIIYALILERQGTGARKCTEVPTSNGFCTERPEGDFPRKTHKRVVGHP